MASLNRVQGAFSDAVETIVNGFDEIQKAPSSIQSASRTVDVTTQFYLVPSGVSVARDYDFDPTDSDHRTRNGGSVSFADGQYTLSTDTQTDSRATLSTVKIGEYRSGGTGIVGWYQRLEEALQDDEYAKGGYFYPEGDNGIYTRQVEQGFEFIVEALGTETVFRRYQGDWDTNGIQEADDDSNTVLSGYKWGGTIKGAEAGPFGIGTESTTENASGFDFPVPRQKWCVMMARSVGGSSATVTPSFTMLEAK